MAESTPQHQEQGSAALSPDGSVAGVNEGPAAPEPPGRAGVGAAFLARLIGVVLIVVLCVVLATVVLPLAVVFLTIAALAIVYLIGRAYLVHLLARYRDPARGRRNVRVRPPTDPSV